MSRQRMSAPWRHRHNGLVDLQEDWKKARQIAERVPRNGKPRQLGDCLIRAIAARLKYYDMQTADDSFSR